MFECSYLTVCINSYRFFMLLVLFLLFLFTLRHQMYRIVDMIGMPPEHMLERGKSTHKFFNKRRVSHSSPPTTADSLHQQRWVYSLKTEEVKSS